MRSTGVGLCMMVIVTATAPVAAVTHTTLAPADAGTVRFLPSVNILERSLNTDIVSSCQLRLGVIVDFRRGFVEFAIPTFRKAVDKAVLVITDNNGAFTPSPAPPAVHEISFYPGDLRVETTDYDVPTTLIGTFETSINDDPSNPRPLRFDVTEAVRQSQGGNLGFRIKLQLDPQECPPLNNGSEFGSLFQLPPILEITSRGTPGPR